MKIVELIRCNSIAECNQFVKEHPDAVMVGWPSSLIPEQWFWMYKIEVEQ
jgi:hypothetical protein